MGQIVFCKHMAFTRCFKAGWALKEVYPQHKLTLLTTRILHSPELFENVFDEIIYTDKDTEFIKNWVSKNNDDVSVYHVYDDGSHHVAKAVIDAAGNKPICYDANDMSALYHGEDIPGQEGMEKACVERADGFALKFPESALDWYKENGYNIKGKYLEYVDYCIPDMFASRAPVEGPRHLTHCGVTGGLGQGKRGYNNQHIHWIPTLLNQGYHFHLYVSPWIGIPPEYLKLMEKSNRFTANKGLNMPTIQKVIQHYHWGCQIHDFRHSDKIPIFHKTAFSHKVTTYLEAGLPLIVSDNLTWSHDLLVKRLGVGIGVTFDNDLKDFKEREQAIDYKDLKKQVIAVRNNEMNAFVQVHRLVDFYKELGAKL